jgi:hypothetical protein
MAPTTYPISWYIFAKENLNIPNQQAPFRRFNNQWILNFGPKLFSTVWLVKFSPWNHIRKVTSQDQTDTGFAKDPKWTTNPVSVWSCNATFLIWWLCRDSQIKPSFFVRKSFSFFNRLIGRQWLESISNRLVTSRSCLAGGDAVKYTQKGC